MSEHERANEHAADTSWSKEKRLNNCESENEEEKNNDTDTEQKWNDNGNEEDWTERQFSLRNENYTRLKLYYKKLWW